MKLEESEGEGYHRDISIIGTKWAASLVHTWAGFMRQDANFMLYDKMVAADRKEEFHKCIKYWKAFAQKSSSTRAALTPTRMKTKQFLNYVYRTGDYSYDEYGKIKTTLRMYGHRGVKQGSDMRKEYIQAIMDAGGTYSIPIVDEQPDVPETADLALACKLWEDAAKGKFLAFRVLSDKPTKLQYHGNYEMIFGDMCMPMITQQYEQWCPTTTLSYPQQGMTVFAKDDPDLVDAISQLGSWNAIRIACRSWKV